MNKNKHCYQVILKGPESQIIKRANKGLLPLPSGKHLFLYYRDAKAFLRAYIQRHLDAWDTSKCSLMAQTSFDLDFKPMTDIADDRKPSSGYTKDQLSAANGNPRSIWNEEF